ncbi:MAG: lipid A phosphoethanolamine transferase [Tannerellaceae bacterium]|jgi:glucan phosphoethanolaminetransferase (alkaline phosphatase superfamily)|nr:lipid A phosphoethanolamine transferase [Tannerellaceae bacterium]
MKMNSLIKVKDWLSIQKHFYFLFGLLFIIPNCVLFVTDPMPVTVGIASIAIPLAIWLGILLLLRKPGIIVWILLPKVILDGGQLVLLHLFGESVIAVDMFLNLTSSNVSEASELLGNIFLVIICVFLLYTLPTLCLAAYSTKVKDRLPDEFRKKWGKISLLLFIVGALSGSLSFLQGHAFSVKKDIYPMNALYNLYFAFDKANRNKNYALTSAGFTFNASKPVQVDNNREIYVLVVGETARAMEWSLYGYGRETSPRMDKLPGLVYFKDAITQSNNTHKSVPIILSAASAEDYDILYQKKSIITAFKEAGFRTVAIVNQKLTGSLISTFYREADTYIDMSAFHTGSYLASSYDDAILPHLQKEVNDAEGNLFIVLHTYGSHFNYSERYPKEFAYYTPDKSDRIRATCKNKLRNAYDNSILFTDYVLGEVVSILEKSGACSSMLYLSDHGEDIFDDARARYLHASPIPTYYQLHIPYLLWFSDSYQRGYPEKYRQALEHKALPVSTNSVFHTMLDLAGIETKEADPSLALTNEAFIVRSRMYLDDHDDPAPFWKVGLKKLDFEMMNKWNISYGDE